MDIASPTMRLINKMEAAGEREQNLLLDTFEVAILGDLISHLYECIDPDTRGVIHDKVNKNHRRRSNLDLIVRRKQ